MRILLVHQNFPGQFRQLAPFLLRAGHELVAICSHKRPIGFQCRVLRYEPTNVPKGLSLNSELSMEAFDRAIKVSRLCNQLKEEGWNPDRICAHSGWGETLAINEVWEDVPQILWPELWVRPEHGGYGVDPLKPKPTLDHHLEQLVRNTLTRSALDLAKASILPTKHQANSFPRSYQKRNMHVIHEGIDTNFALPNLDISFEVRGIKIDRNIPTITFVNRNLERLRGFDNFMRSLPHVMGSNKSVRVLIVGETERGYGGCNIDGKTLKDALLEELKGQLDLERIHFLGRIPHRQLIAIFQASWVHVYMSYPFILGWSLLEAMASGCCIIGSKGMPVEEVIVNGFNGLLIPMDSPELLAEKIDFLLKNENLRTAISKQARISSLEWDQSKTLPAIENLILNP